jgi:hypothetical protein
MSNEIAEILARLDRIESALTRQGISLETLDAPTQEPAGGARCDYRPIDVKSGYEAAIASLEQQLSQVDAKILAWQQGKDLEYPLNSNMIPPYGAQRSAIVAQLENLRERLAKETGTYRSYMQRKIEQNNVLATGAT